jgi:Na+:H+ antiporter, NhaC family
MDLLLFIIISFVLLLISATKGYFLLYPLLISMAILIVILLNRSFQLKSSIEMAITGSRKSFSVIGILLLIGAVMAVWMAAGTVPVIVYYGIKFISPHYFIFSAFILTSIISILIGTSFGTVSTIGIALMIMSSGNDVNPHIIAGAIIAGAYFGDRCSPMSSSANLIAVTTSTKIYTNLKNMLKTSIYPLIFSCFLYLIISFGNPVNLNNNDMAAQISMNFNTDLASLLPALTILILGILRIDVRFSMAISLIVGIAIALSVQDYSLIELINFIIMGFELESPSSLKYIMAGGGIISMIKVSTIVIISTAFAGIFAGTRILEFIEVYLTKAQTRGDLFFGTTVIGVLSAAFGCTQTIGILLTHQLVEEKYEAEGLDNYQLAVDLENTVVVISPLIPWNIAGLVPATVLVTDSGFIPYAFYLYLIPLFNLIQMKLAKSSKLK